MAVRFGVRMASLPAYSCISRIARRRWRSRIRWQITYFVGLARKNGQALVSLGFKGRGGGSVGV